MESFIFTLFFFLVALGVLITVHEFGHFWVARRLGVKVLRFSIGFGRPLWKRIGKKDATEYVVAALPLGGYVKMLDEREGPVREDELSRAFNRASLGTRTAIVSAGPAFNFLFAILAYWLIFVTGDTGIRPVVGDVESGSIAEEAGFQIGDELLSIGDRSTPSWESAVYALLAESLGANDVPVRVRDDGHLEQIRWLRASALKGLSEDGQILGRVGLSPSRPEVPPVIGELVPGEAAERSGLQSGDRILSADGREMENWADWVKYVQAHPDQTLDIELERDGEVISLPLLTSSLESHGKLIGRIGASARIPQGLFERYRTEVRLGPVAAMGAALYKTWDLSVLMLKMLGQMLVGEVSVKNLSGPISIAETAGKSASFGFLYFLKFLAVVSISLGVLNLLPIPVLDGGHLLFFLAEAIKGSPLSDQALMHGQKIGIILLLALMTLAFYVDLSRLLG